jgi:hypothetical protein
LLLCAAVLQDSSSHEFAARSHKKTHIEHGNLQAKTAMRIHTTLESSVTELSLYGSRGAGYNDDERTCRGPTSTMITGLLGADYNTDERIFSACARRSDRQGVDVLAFVAVVCTHLSSTELCHLSRASIRFWPNHSFAFEVFCVLEFRFELGENSFAENFFFHA